MFDIRTDIKFPASILLISFLLSCSADNNNSKHVSKFSSIQATSLLTLNDQIAIAGSARDSISSIKFPFVMVFDSLLYKKSQQLFRTKTSIRNPEITQFTDVEFLFSYYRPVSLSNQEEVSEIHFLDHQLYSNRTILYGNRTRIKDLAVDENEAIITLNYERTTQEISLRYTTQSTLDEKISFSESEESNIPTALIALHPTGLAFSGIAHGFHYPDGHDYKNPKTYGFIISTDLHGHKKQVYKHQGDGHVFINDIIQANEEIFAIGTYQSSHTGMDVLMLKLDTQLKLQSETVYPQEGIQEGLLIKQYKKQLFIVGVEENLQDNKLKSRLQCLDTNLDIKWTTSIDEIGSCSPQDLIIFKDQLILLVNSTTTRTEATDSYIYIYSLQGKMLKKKKII